MKKSVFISIIAAIAITAVACEKQGFEPKLERGEIEITRADLTDTYWYRTITTEDYDADGVLSYCPAVIDPASYVPNSGRITLMNKDRIVIYVEEPRWVDPTEGVACSYVKYTLKRVYPNEGFFETFAEWLD